jgi:hypothetical protein
MCDQQTQKREAKGPSWTISACEYNKIENIIENRTSCLGTPPPPAITVYGLGLVTCSYSDFFFSGFTALFLI